MITFPTSDRLRTIFFGRRRPSPTDRPQHFYRIKATVARLQEAEVLLLPGSQQIVPGRRIVGATIHTDDLEALRRVLSTNLLDIPQAVTIPGGRSIFIPPQAAHGIWLEFRQDNTDNP